MSEEKIYERLHAIDQKHTERTDELRSELNLHINAINGHMNSMVTSTAVISERLKNLSNNVNGIPAHPPRPCEHFNNHVQEHKEKEREAKESQKLWQQPIFSTVLDLIKMGIVFLLAFLWGKHK